VLKQLQRVTLLCQGLSTSHPFGKGKKAILSVFEHLGYVQIDTLSVIERVHHHIIWTRFPGYKIEYLEQLVKEHKVFEYWFHAASYLPMRDFRYALPQMLHFQQKLPLKNFLCRGDLMVSGRDGMDKIYDLTERVLPDTINTTEPEPLEFAEYLVNTHLRAYGVTTVKQITHLRPGKVLRKNVELVLQTMLEAKKYNK